MNAHSRPNMNYGLRNVTEKELVAAFGSAERALAVTGGDEPTALFYLNNPDLIADAPASGVIRESSLTSELRKSRDYHRACERKAAAERAARERADADAALAETAKLMHDAMEKPSVSAVARKLGVHWHRAKALLGQRAA